MKTRRFPVMGKCWPIAVLIFVVLLWIGIAAATADLDEQLVEAAKCADVALVKSPRHYGPVINARNNFGVTALDQVSLGRQRPSGNPNHGHAPISVAENLSAGFGRSGEAAARAIRKEHSQHV
jgi:hypothetical protein